MNVVLAPVTPPRHTARSAHRTHPGFSAGSRAPAREQSRPSPSRDEPITAPFWQGAWVGWLTCQAVLVLLVESTELAADPRLALMTRALVLLTFVAAFRKPCFSTSLQRHAFTFAVLGAEIVIAGCSERLTSSIGWPLWTALAAALLLLSTLLTSDSRHPTRDSNRTTSNRLSSTAPQAATLDVSQRERPPTHRAQSRSPSPLP